MEKHLKVSAIKEGTVIDHIPADQLFKVIDILGLSKIPNQITFGTNLDSKLLGKKAIIKICWCVWRLCKEETNAVVSKGLMA